jgi:hypothetical protein
MPPSLLARADEVIEQGLYAANAQVRTWHTFSVRGAAAIRSGF